MNIFELCPPLHDIFYDICGTKQKKGYFVSTFVLCRGVSVTCKLDACTRYSECTLYVVARCTDTICHSLFMFGGFQF